MTLSCISMGYATITAPPPRPPPAADANSTAAVVKVISTMYRGGGLEPAACTERCSFDDPAASVRGRAEVIEAFRALRITRPVHVEEPVGVSKADGSVEIHLRNRYFGLLDVSSCVDVRTAADGRICEITERWNGAPLLEWPAFRFSRRLNGMISALLTPLMVGDQPKS